MRGLILVLCLIGVSGLAPTPGTEQPEVKILAPAYPAKLKRVVDGDTVRLTVQVGFELTRGEQPYRLLGIDAPERYTRDGRRVKELLTDHLKGKDLVAVGSKADNFGRYLIELYADGANVNQWMLDRGYAVPWP